MAHIDLSWTELFAHRQINRQMCEFNVMVSESDGIVAELTPGDFQVLGSWVDNFSSSVSVSFADLRSMTRVYDLCEQQVLNSQPHMRPDTVRFLVDKIVERGMELVSQHGEDDVNFGYVIDARVDVENFRVADEEDLAICKQFDDMEEEEGGIEDYDRDENEDDIEGVDNDNDDDGIEDYDWNENEDDIEGVEIDEDDDRDMYEDDDIDMYEDDDMDMYEDDEANPRFRGVEEGKYDGGDGKEVITCSVCLEDLSSGMEFNKLPCSHTFHSSCIDHWLRRNRSCPNCRAELTKLEERGQCVIA